MQFPAHKIGIIFTGFILYLISAYGQEPANHSASNYKPQAVYWLPDIPIDQSQLYNQLEMFDSVGLGGIHLIPVKGNKSKLNNDYWHEVFNSSINKCSQLGLSVNIPFFSGQFPFFPFDSSQILAKKLVIQAIDSIIPDTILRASINRVKLFNGSLAGIFAISEDMHEKIDIRWLLDKPNYSSYFSDSSGWKIYLFTSRNVQEIIENKTPGITGPITDIFSVGAINQYTKCLEEDYLKHLILSPNITFSNIPWSFQELNWSDDFLNEFAVRRNYNLADYLYCFIDEYESDIQSRVICDYYQTVSELIEENYFGLLNNWTNSLNIAFQANTDNFPGNIIDLYKNANSIYITQTGLQKINVPFLNKEVNFTSDYYGKPNLKYFKFATSAANLNNISMVSCELGHFMGNYHTVSVPQLKVQADLLFANGINQIVYKGITYSSGDCNWTVNGYNNFSQFGPGSNNWADLKNLNQYIERCQEILQNSTPDNDILIYFPIYDYWSEPKKNFEFYRFGLDNVDEWLVKTSTEDIAYELAFKGYGFDFISDKQLQEIEIHDRQMQAGNAKYKMLFIPKCNYMPLKTLEKIYELADNDIKIFFVDGLPRDITGFYEYEKQRRSLLELKYTIFVNPNVSVIRDLSEAYELENFRNEVFPYYELSYIRKNYKSGKVYFISNLSNNVINGYVPLAYGSNNIQMVNPVTGAKGKAEVNEMGEVRLQLKQGQSVFLFTKDFLQDNWLYKNLANPPFEITGKWKVCFPQGFPEANDTLYLKKLDFINQLSYEKFKYYSGKIKYEIEFDLPADFSANAYTQLSFEQIRETAEVTLNGVNIGKIWCLPNDLLLSPKSLKKKNNKLEVLVSTNWANRVIYSELEKKKQIQDVVGFAGFENMPFDITGWAPYDVGISGVVKLIQITGEIGQ